MSTLESLLADAAQLPVADRLELIDAIWDTLPDEALPPLSDEWMTEIGRRSAEFYPSAVVGIIHTDTFRHLDIIDTGKPRGRMNVRHLMTVSVHDHTPDGQRYLIRTSVQKRVRGLTDKAAPVSLKS